MLEENNLTYFVENITFPTIVIEMAMKLKRKKWKGEGRVACRTNKISECSRVADSHQEYIKMLKHHIKCGWIKKSSLKDVPNGAFTHKYVKKT